MHVPTFPVKQGNEFFQWAHKSPLYLVERRQDGAVVGWPALLAETIDLD